MKKNMLLDSVKIKADEDISTNAKTEKFAGKILEDVLKRQGYLNIRKYGASADYVAEKNNTVFYFELKSSKKEKYFGSASFSEWGLAFEKTDNYFFIVALIDEQKQVVDFYQYTPKEFIKFCSIPPIKVFFNICINETNPQAPAKSNSEKRRKTTALRLTEENYDALSRAYQKIKEKNNRMEEKE